MSFLRRAFSDATSLRPSESQIMRKNPAVVLFVESFVFMLEMGGISSQCIDESSSMHWMAQSINIVSQRALLGGVMILHHGDCLERIYWQNHNRINNIILLV